MKAIINTGGNLEVLRAVLWRPQLCQYATENEGNVRYCGDQCPMFKETTCGGELELQLMCGREVVYYRIMEDRRGNGAAMKSKISITPA